MPGALLFLMRAGELQFQFNRTTTWPRVRQAYSGFVCSHKALNPSSFHQAHEENMTAHARISAMANKRRDRDDESVMTTMTKFCILSDALGAAAVVVVGLRNSPFYSPSPNFSTSFIQFIEYVLPYLFCILITSRALYQGQVQFFGNNVLLPHPQKRAFMLEYFKNNSSSYKYWLATSSSTNMLSLAVVTDMWTRIFGFPIFTGPWDSLTPFDITADWSWVTTNNTLYWVSALGWTAFCAFIWAAVMFILWMHQGTEILCCIQLFRMKIERSKAKDEESLIGECGFDVKEESFCEKQAVENICKANSSTSEAASRKRSSPSSDKTVRWGKIVVIHKYERDDDTQAAEAAEESKKRVRWGPVSIARIPQDEVFLVKEPDTKKSEGESGASCDWARPRA
ncbi:hypothetical protein BJ878DRAFT_576172 [Calycina marina]|uniref:Uncharacterized protein n=1 Tax=Calycina marina TaxID=1763456 RepID=A0A9P8CEB5_9HELO|nr:hypothetical protein BJ878DRAFT_576172 [Calycina marina]